ncbi:MAG TPA: hypothetical protein H9870_01180 [Candidatus Corynebacterium avicola]|uniref:Uncharacterized protein n=1 Tax=Candidatus Corynebacterium avicola TaxID=2838527 RepID=A0A9D1RMK6_9CORY|nr:hypothetical protein [Candidatus Corynebacterium avicola]
MNDQTPHAGDTGDTGDADRPSPATLRNANNAGNGTNVEDLVAEVDRLLASDAEGNDEAALLEQAHRLINDALEGR